MASVHTHGTAGPTLPQKLLRLNWPLVVLIVLVAAIGFAMQYSVADGSVDPYARKQMIRFAVSFVGMLVVAMIDIRFWRGTAYLFYALSLALLVGVELAGSIGMGAQRWIDIGPIRLQPSELMKIALVVALARYFHDLNPRRVRHILTLIPPLVMIAIPAALVVKQPDLGTAVLLAAGGIIIMFLAGVSLWFFAALVAGAGGLVYAVFASKGQDWALLKPYQYDRIAVFLNPELDPRGAGYHITQSKIAFGSGGVMGEGYLQGPQSRLDFLPEKHTDFIFTVLGEEFGLVGSLVLLGLYMVVLLFGLMTALRIKHLFGRLVAAGVCMTFFAYFAINMAMVMGLAPVVGVPLPLVSYGGTSMLVLLFGFGLLLSAQVHGRVVFPRRGTVL